MHVSVKYDTALAQRVRAKLSKLPARLDLEGQLDRIAKQTVDRLPKWTPGRRLRAAWTIKKSKTGPGIRIDIINLRAPELDDYVTLWIEEGTKPHLIVPVNAKVLAFTAKSGDRVFARHAVHPGTKAYKPIDRGEKFVQAKINAMEREFRKALRRASK